MSITKRLRRLSPLILVGKYLETRARSQASSAVRTLIGLQPENDPRTRAGVTIEVPTVQVRRGEIVIVKPGVTDSR
jgi:Cu+-exporting ATPase